MEQTEKIGFAEWCKEYRKILSEDELDSYLGDFLSDIDFDRGAGCPAVVVEVITMTILGLLALLVTMVCIACLFVDKR